MSPRLRAAAWVGLCVLVAEGFVFGLAFGIPVIAHLIEEG